MHNNHNYHGSKEPVECDKCHSSMTQEKVGRYDILKCDNAACVNVIELKGDSDE